MKEKSSVIEITGIERVHQKIDWCLPTTIDYIWHPGHHEDGQWASGEVELTAIKIYIGKTSLLIGPAQLSEYERDELIQVVEDMVSVGGGGTIADLRTEGRKI